VANAVTDCSILSVAVALEGIEEGAVRAGLPRTTARAFIRQALLGTAGLLEDTSVSPAELKDQVASPGGTTIAGLAVLEDHGVRGALIRALEIAAGRYHQPREGKPASHD
jgi:pyrroline-5-carboxylate reductase